MSDVKIKYSGNTLTTLRDTGIVKLNTDGKYLEDKIEVDFTDLYTWMGKNPELVQSYAKETIKLSDTGYASWTPSTTATAIIASTNLGTQVLDMANYEYIILWRFLSDFVYGSSATNVARTVKVAQAFAQMIFRRPSNLTNMQSGNNNGNAQQNMGTFAVQDYYNANGSHTIQTSPSYSVYASIVSPTFSNNTSLTPTLTIKKPNINARASATYFSTDNANAVNQESTKLYLKCDFYRIKKDTTDFYNMWQRAVDIYRNGIE